VKRLSPSRRQCIRQLLALEIGDRKSSQFLRHLRTLAPDVPDDFLHTNWSSRLPPKFRPFSSASPIAAWTPQPAVRTASLGRTTAGASERWSTPRTAPHFRRGSRTSPARWQHSALSRTVFAPAPGTLAPIQDQEPPPGQQIPLPRRHRTHPLLVPPPLRSPGAKVNSAVLLPPAGQTNAADITGGTCLLYDRPPLHYGETW
jgi:hypothetical protein